jgi:Asp-tRNA(Asn)/Glu-tRNA(Gln) amidotransferase A subunit family amidase
MRVVELKGTHGLASIRGIIPLSESHDHVGPICRSVADSAHMLTVLAAVDPLDPMSIASAPANYADAIGRPVSSLRIGVPRAPFFADLDPEIGTAVETALGVIRTLTRSVVDVTVPAVDTLGMPSAEIYAYHAKFVTDQERRKLYQPQTLRLILDSADISLPIRQPD